MKLLPKLALLSLVIAGPAFAQAMPADDYVKAAGASDLFERQSSQVVLQTTTNAKVRDFAKMMLTAHTKSTTDIKAAAMRSKVRVASPQLMPAQVDMLAQLRAQTGAARDATYLQQQKTAHAQTLILQRGYAANGKAAPLKMVAAKIVPVVQMHIEMLDTM